jgi:membrane fusion protein (multidrug efflux system)
MKLVRGRKGFVVSLIAGLLLAAVVAGAGLYLTRGGGGKDDPHGTVVARAGAAEDTAPPSGGGASGSDTPAEPAKGDEGASAGGDKKKDEKGEGKTGEKANGKSAVPVSVAPIGVGAVSSYITSTANLVPENEVKVLAEAEGRVSELLVEEGDRVSKGRLLAALVRDEEEIALRKADLKATNARLAHERAVKVVDENLMSREAFDKIVMDKEIAEQELAEARWRLDKTLIKAPFGGRVTERNIKLGQHIRPGDVLFTVSDFDPLIARIFLPERDLFGLKEGREVRITLKANEETRFRGRIRQISPVVDTATGTVKVTVEAVAPPDEVRPGAFVTIGIVRETRPRAVLLPREAVIRELQDAYVFVAKGDVAEKRPVALGLEEAGLVEAISGVKPGEQVIVAGQGGLKNGSPIKVIPPSEASDLGARRERPRRG